jgi:hypothetical protein
MTKAIAYAFDDYRKQTNASLFKNLLYVFILLKCFFWSLNFDLLFGENALSYIPTDIVTIEEYKNKISFGKHFAFLLMYSTQTWHFVFALITLAGISIFSINKRSYYVLDAIVYFLILNINLKTYASTTAGDPLLSNLCFLSIFLRNDFTRTQGVWGDLKILFHNFSFLALITQVCIVYFYSALAKWYDPDWVHGEAIYLVNQARHYSNWFLVKNADSIHAFSVFITYFILIYQSAFPVFAFLPKIKKYFLHIGVLTHLYISFVIGLFFFGLIMALTYVLFYDFEDNDIQTRETLRHN